MAQDPDAAPGGLETVVGSCYDAQTRVVYVVTSACNLYGIHIGKDSGGGDASRPFLRMSLLVGGGGDGALADEEPALPARSVVVGVEYIAELRGVCIAAASGELILVAPDPDDDHATTTARGAATVGEAGAINAGLFAVAILARNDEKLNKALSSFRTKQRTKVRAMKLPTKKRITK